MTIGIYLNEEAEILFYGEKAGKAIQEKGVAYVKHKYRCGELLHVLDTWNLKPAWIPNENLEHLYQIGDLVELTDNTICLIDAIDSSDGKKKTADWGEDYHIVFESERTSLHCHQWFRAYDILRLIRGKTVLKSYVCTCCGQTHVQLEREYKTVCPNCTESNEKERIALLQHVRS